MKLYLRRATHSQAHDNYRVPRDNQDETAVSPRLSRDNRVIRKREEGDI